MTRVGSASTRTLQGVVKPLRIGFIPVADCAPLLVARELDLFRRHGVQIEFSCEVGWATIREKLLYGQVDAAHAVAGLAFALSLGLGSSPFPVVAPFVFNLHGNAITLSMDLWNRGVRDAVTFKKLILGTSRRFTLGMVSNFSSHHFLLRDWLLSGGINPDRDVRIVPLPPTQMAPSMKEGLIDGYCVGEPWNSVAVSEGYGWVVSTSSELAPNHPEKVLLVGQDFAATHTEQIQALVAALKEACAYCDVPGNRPHVVRVLHQSGYFRCSEAVLARSLVGPFETGTGKQIPASLYQIFSSRDANHPAPDKGAWVINQLLKHGVIPDCAEAQLRALLPLCWRPLIQDSSGARDAPRKPTSTRKTPAIINS